MATTSEHIDPAVPPSGIGCADCDEAGVWWLHLRRCAACGNIGCCDTSPGQHAHAHFRLSGHAVIQSFEPGEDWCWDFERRTDVLAGPLAPPTSRPLGQSVPGPAGRVPEDWEDQLHP